MNYRVEITSSHGWAVENGTVTRWSEDHATGERQEATEPLCESPVRDVLSPSIWDLAADPRSDL